MPDLPIDPELDSLKQVHALQSPIDPWEVLTDYLNDWCDLMVPDAVDARDDALGALTTLREQMEDLRAINEGHEAAAADLRGWLRQHEENEAGFRTQAERQEAALLKLNGVADQAIVDALGPIDEGIVFDVTYAALSPPTTDELTRDAVEELAESITAKHPEQPLIVHPRSLAEPTKGERCQGCEDAPLGQHTGPHDWEPSGHQETER